MSKCFSYSVYHENIISNIKEVLSIFNYSATMKSLNKFLPELEELGIGIALDDFVTGYSSFGYLKDLPFTELKK